MLQKIQRAKFIIFSKYRKNDYFLWGRCGQLLFVVILLLDVNSARQGRWQKLNKLAETVSKAHLRFLSSRLFMQVQSNDVRFKECVCLVGPDRCFTVVANYVIGAQNKFKANVIIG